MFSNCVSFICLILYMKQVAAFEGNCVQGNPLRDILTCSESSLSAYAQDLFANGSFKVNPSFGVAWSSAYVAMVMEAHTVAETCREKLISKHSEALIPFLPPGPSHNDFTMRVHSVAYASVKVSTELAPLRY